MVTAGVLAAGACAPPKAATPPPAPATAPSAEDDPPPPPLVSLPPATVMTACVVRDGAFTQAAFEYHPATGDSTVNGRLFREVFPVTAEHARDAAWYVNHEPITFKGRRYVKYGLPRVLGSADVVPAGSYRGVAVFVETGENPDRPDIIYLVVDPRCEFQSYHGAETGGAVRG